MGRKCLRLSFSKLRYFDYLRLSSQCLEFEVNAGLCFFVSKCCSKHFDIFHVKRCYGSTALNLMFLFTQLTIRRKVSTSPTNVLKYSMLMQVSAYLSVNAAPSVKCHHCTPMRKAFYMHLRTRELMLLLHLDHQLQI